MGAQTRQAVRCIGCGLNFISTVAYLHPTHGCVVSRHPSARQPAWVKTGREKDTK